MLTFWLRGPLRALFVARNILAAPVKLMCYTMLLYFENVQACKQLNICRHGDMVYGCIQSFSGSSLDLFLKLFIASVLGSWLCELLLKCFMSMLYT